MSRFRFFENNTEGLNRSSAIQDTISAPADDIEMVIPTHSENARYRVEQLTITKLDGVVHSHAETKREFSVIRSFRNKELVIEVRMEDNIVRVYPDTLQETINFIIELDLVKSDAIILVDQQEGKVARILNHDEIIEKWKNYRKVLELKFSTFSDQNLKLNLLKFLTIAEHTIVIEKNLINDLYTKMFYDLFFDKYLIQDNFDDDNFSRPFYSQLFEGESSLLEFSTKITAETENQIRVTKSGVLDLKSTDQLKYEKLYDEKYKPMIQYKYSDYEAKITEQITFDKKNRWIERAEVTIIEEVKNNVEIIVDYKLKKIS